MHVMIVSWTFSIMDMAVGDYNIRNRHYNSDGVKIVGVELNEV